jgi:hypothetical protein
MSATNNNLQIAISHEEQQAALKKVALETYPKQRPFDVQRYFDSAMQLPHHHCASVVLKYQHSLRYFVSARIEVINDESVRFIGEINPNIWHIYPSNFVDITLTFDYDRFLSWYHNDPKKAHELQPWTKDLIL